MEEIREKKLRQVRALLEKAAHPNTPPAEAQALREKADDLMLVYTIELWEAQLTKPEAQRKRPEWRYIEVCGRDNPIKTQLLDLMVEVVQHCRCRAMYSGLQVQKAGSTAHAVGFENDLDYVEVLFVSLHVQLARELEPHYDPSMTQIENLVMMKEAGLKWKRIHQLLYPDDPHEVTKAQGVKYTKMYTDYCNLTGRKRQYTNPVSYQRNYAEGFVLEVARRLRDIRRHQQQSGLSGTGMELAIRDEVKEAYQDAKPGKGVKLAGRSRFDVSAVQAGQAAGAKADLGQQRMDRRKELS